MIQVAEARTVNIISFNQIKNFRKVTEVSAVVSSLLAPEVKPDSSPVYFYTRSGIGVPFLLII